MRHGLYVMGAAVMLCAACEPSVNVDQERDTLLQRDREFSQTTKDTDQFVSFFAPDGSVYAQGMPVVTGSAAIKDAFTEMSSEPGFALSWIPTRADVSAAGDIGYTIGTYEMGSSALPAPDKGKYVTVWKKQTDGTWKVAEDIFNADSSGQPPPSSHVLVTPSALIWGEQPPSLPPGAKMAVISGDPSKPAPFVIRAQLPAGYLIPPHWHPTDENVTVLSGTFAVGMGEKFDEAALKDLPEGGVAVLPAEMRHFAMARTATTIQAHGMGPLVLYYVNPSDDPSQKQ